MKRGRYSNLHLAPGISALVTNYSLLKGEIACNHVAEKILAGAAPEVVFIRCAYFMENWAMALQGLSAEPPFVCTTISPASHAVPMVCFRPANARRSYAIINTS